MWTAILLVAVLSPLFRAEFNKSHITYPTQKACEAAMGEQSKIVTKAIKAKFGNNVVVVGQCVQNFQPPPMGPHGEPLPPPSSQAPQPHQPPSSEEGNAPPGSSAPTTPTPPEGKPEAPGSDGAGKNFR